MDDEYNPTDLAFETLPSRVLIKAVKELNIEIKREHEELHKTELEKHDLEHKCRDIETKNEELGRIQERFKQAMKKKLEETKGIIAFKKN